METTSELAATRYFARAERSRRRRKEKRSRARTPRSLVAAASQISWQRKAT